MKKVICVLAVMVIVGTVWAANAKPKVELVKGDNKIDVMIGGKLFTSYIFGDGLPKPSLVPVRTPSGIEVSRRNPLVDLEGGSDDHLHHVGLFFSVDGVNGTKFWNNKGTSPQIKHIKTMEATDGAGKGTLSTEIHWINKSGKVLLEEKRTMAFLAGDHQGEYAIDFSTVLTAKDTTVTFDDTEEGVFAIRMADCLREEGPKKFLRPGQPIPKESIEGTGVYLSSNGDVTAKRVWGKRARWMAMQGVRQGKVVGVAILNHPESINYPTYWHARDYGLFSANPLGQGDFQRQDDYEKNPIIPLQLTLKPGKSAYFRFLVIAYEGVRTQEELEKRFKEFEK
jgi:hypothetical protein